MDNNSSFKINEQNNRLYGFPFFWKFSINCPSFVVGTGTVIANSTVKILGVTLDETINLENHITNIVRSFNMQLCKISSIRRYLCDGAIKTLVQSTVISCLITAIAYIDIVHNVFENECRQ